MPINDDVKKQFEKWGKTPPSSQSHGTEEDIQKKLVQLKPKEWKLDGNRLIGMTEVGPLVQFIPTDYILEGTDKKGLPKFKKIDL